MRSRCGGRADKSRFQRLAPRVGRGCPDVLNTTMERHRPSLADSCTVVVHESAGPPRLGRLVVLCRSGAPNPGGGWGSRDRDGGDGAVTERWRSGGGAVAVTERWRSGGADGAVAQTERVARLDRTGGCVAAPGRTCVTGQLTRSATALASGACGACLPGQGWARRRAVARYTGRPRGGKGERATEPPPACATRHLAPTRRAVTVHACGACVAWQGHEAEHRLSGRAGDRWRAQADRGTPGRHRRPTGATADRRAPPSRPTTARPRTQTLERHTTPTTATR